MKRLGFLVLAISMSGCSYNMQLMARDDGKIYSGSAKSNGAGSGILTVNLGDKTCSGSFVKAVSGDSFGFIQSFGARGVNSSTLQSFGSSQYKGILSCSDGTGLRCDVVGTSTGGGVCVDSKNKVYDMIYS
jgi:hypothetical protein